MGAAHQPEPAHLLAGFQQECSRLLHSETPARARGKCLTLAAVHVALKAAHLCLDELLLLGLSQLHRMPLRPCCCPSQTGSEHCMRMKTLWTRQVLHLLEEPTSKCGGDWSGREPLDHRLLPWQSAIETLKRSGCFGAASEHAVVGNKNVRLAVFFTVDGVACTQQKKCARCSCQNARSRARSRRCTASAG